MEDQDDVGFLDDLLRKTGDLSYGEFYSGQSPYNPNQNYEDLLSPNFSARTDCLPVGRTGTPLDLFPWDSLTPFESAQGPTSFSRSYSPLEEELLVQEEAERIADMVSSFLQVPDNLVGSSEDLDSLEGTFSAALEKCKRYQNELRAAVATIDQVEAGNRQGKQKVLSARKRIAALQSKGRSPSVSEGPLGCALKSSTMISSLLGLSSEQMLAQLDERAKIVYDSLNLCEEISKKEKQAKWSTRETQCLVDGVKRANQRILLEGVLAEHSGEEARLRIQQIQSIPDQELLSNVAGIDWEFISSGFLHGARSARDCQIQWTVNQHPIINNEAEWKTDELAQLERLVQKHGPNGKWTEIASELGTNRPAYLCLTVYQKRLNKALLKGRWSPEEDRRLLDLVEANRLGDDDINWVRVTAKMPDRTPTQCIHRYYKNMDPNIRRGRWTEDEDDLLKLGVLLHGRDWYLVCRWVPKRTDMQCRERWTNVLDPDIKMDTFTTEEDEKLLAAVEEAGGPGQWAAIQAKHFSERTDNQLRRRYRQLSGTTTTRRPKSSKSTKPSLDQKSASAPQIKPVNSTDTGKKRGRPKKEKPETAPLPPRVVKRLKPGFERRTSSRNTASS